MPYTYTKHPLGTAPSTNAERIPRYRQRRKAQGLGECVQVLAGPGAIHELSAHVRRPYRENL